MIVFALHNMQWCGGVACLSCWLPTITPVAAAAALGILYWHMYESTVPRKEWGDSLKIHRYCLHIHLATENMLQLCLFIYTNKTFTHCYSDQYVIFVNIAGGCWLPVCVC